MFGQKNFGPKKRFGPKKFLSPKDLGSNNFWVYKNLYVKEIFGSNFGLERNFESEKMWSIKILGPIKYWEKFWSSKFDLSNSNNPKLT